MDGSQAEEGYAGEKRVTEEEERATSCASSPFLSSNPNSIQDAVVDDDDVPSPNAVYLPLTLTQETRRPVQSSHRRSGEFESNNAMTEARPFCIANYEMKQHVNSMLPYPRSKSFRDGNGDEEQNHRRDRSIRECWIWNDERCRYKESWIQEEGEETRRERESEIELISSTPMREVCWNPNPPTQERREMEDEDGQSSHWLRIAFDDLDVRSFGVDDLDREHGVDVAFGRLGVEDDVESSKNQSGKGIQTTGNCMNAETRRVLQNFVAAQARRQVQSSATAYPRTSRPAHLTRDRALAYRKLVLLAPRRLSRALVVGNANDFVYLIIQHAVSLRLLQMIKPLLPQFDLFAKANASVKPRGSACSAKAKRSSTRMRISPMLVRSLVQCRTPRSRIPFDKLGYGRFQGCMIVKKCKERGFPSFELFKKCQCCSQLLPAVQEPFIEWSVEHGRREFHRLSQEQASCRRSESNFAAGMALAAF
ncbi:hypothetical protein SCHPADRAFT_930939 [Schizopora paradoxa]|uniref:Uncharacterized protein n=1 Tax=Schizopora paradoxa TaxID=27342 RepID=A0A0H2RE49_9AGAM|nr:hypothetical protein SCHPADRAFT_930939 [Schizopora paradoxa]